MVDAPDTDVVAILTRSPSHGGKTRLFGELNLPCDAALLEALLLDTLDGAATPGVRRILVVTPPDAHAALAAIAPNVPVLPQSDGSLGDRMRETMEAIFATGARRVAVIGSDLPEITGDHIASAFAALRDDSGALVLGPAQDGGYYLIAACHVPPVFDGITWGSADVLTQTRAAAAAAGLRVRTIQTLGDVDTVSDLRRAGRSPACPRTAAWVGRNLAE
jgi:rSAM/selenodomain-associated transferase 1